MQTDTVESALHALAAGKMVLVLDDEDRENEGDLIMAAQLATAADIAFMVRWTSGVLCVGLPAERCRELALPPMVADNQDSMGTAFTVSVDHARGLTTGISASERAATVRALVDPAAVAGEFRRPGHVFPLRAVDGGVLRRPGHTEAAVDLTRLAGLQPGGVLAEVVSRDGSMARGPGLHHFARAFGLRIITIKDLIAYRRRTEKLVARQAVVRLPTAHGVFQLHGYLDLIGNVEHVALTMGEPSQAQAPLVRVHSECMTGEVLGSLRCDCRPQLMAAMAAIGRAGEGVVVYLRGHEGRGIGLMHKLRAYALQDADGADTADANLRLGLPVDGRDYAIGAQILADLGVRRMRLMTNNPGKYDGIRHFGLSIVERVPLIAPAHPESVAYMTAKRDRLGHLLGAGVPF